MNQKCFPFLILLCTLAGAAIVYAGSKTPKVGDVLPEMVLARPADAAHGGYLGLPAGETFTLSDIEADAVIIEIFSMYCPHCQREAPLINRLHEAIENRGPGKGRVKLIGVGAGNSTFEVDVFRKKYKVPFPLFPDPDFIIHKKIGEVRTPYFFAVRIRPEGSHRVVYSKLGGFEDPGRFLDMIVKRAGL